MALERELECISLPASGDLSAYQYRAVLINSGGSVAIATGTASAMIGILQNKPAAAGVAAEVAISGVSKMYSGASVAAGDWITSEGAGLGIPCATSAIRSQVVARAVSPEASGSAGIFEALIQPHSI